MSELISVREGMEEFYQSNDYWLLPLLRAVTAFIVFFTAHGRMGVEGPGGNLFLLLLVSILCALLPWAAIPFFAACFLVADMASASLGLGLTAALLFLLTLLLQTAFRANYAVLLALMPLFFAFRLPYLLPVVAGLSLGISAVIPLSLGSLLYFFLNFASENALGAEKGTDVTELANQYAVFFLRYFADREMLLMTAAIAVCMILVFVIRNMSFDYSWYVASATGLFALFMILLFGGAALGTEVPGPLELLSLLLCFLLSLLHVFLFHNADYEGTQRLQFEDDDYFYYVRAVPKLRGRK